MNFQTIDLTTDSISKQAEMMRLNNYSSQCVVYGIGNYPDLSEWGVDDLINSDNRIKLMMTNLDIVHGLPIQRFCWPKMNKPNYPVISIAPQATGKTYAHLLFMVTRIIIDIPKTKTDQLMLANESLTQDKYVVGQDDGFKPKSSRSSSNSNSTNNINKIDINEIDQENADFDALLNAEFGDNNKSMDQQDAGSDDQWGLADFDPEDLIRHPHYIIICSSTDAVNQINLSINLIKKAAFGHRVTERGMYNMPPKVNKIDNKNLDEERLAVICNQSDIIICTPETILNCIHNDLITFHKCKQLIFDDLDLLLQLHNQSIREIAKHYILQTDQITTTSDSNENIYGMNKPTLPSKENKKCQVFMFSRKWNYLIKQFTETLFLQRILLFNSIAEAALYQKVRFDLEFCFENFHQTRLTKITKLAKYYNDNYKSNNSSGNSGIVKETMMIVCNDFVEAEQLFMELTCRQSISNIYLLDENTLMPSQINHSLANYKRTSRLPIYITCDKSLEFLVDYFNDVTHLVHYSMPDNMLIFDQRFRSMFNLIKDKDNKQSLLSTLFVSDNFKLNHAKDLYDLISRSNTTLRSCKIELRDYINDKSTTICWRWATTGVCILGKLTKGDNKLGTYCSDKHPMQKNFEKITKTANGGECNGLIKKKERGLWPIEGDQCRIVISNFVSPNEFYFWFEQYRNIDEPNWQKVEKSGRTFMNKLEKELYKYRDIPPCSIGLDQFKKDKIYGIYLPAEIRVARVKLIENPIDVFENLSDMNKTKKKGAILTNLNLLRAQEYSKQYYVLQIDYGIKIKAYLKNLFELPKHLVDIEPQCHRGFLLGLTPPRNEPNWTTKAKQLFEQMVNDKYTDEITVWLRQNQFNCYWFESMLIRQRLDNLSALTCVDGAASNVSSQESPISKMIQEQLAEKQKSLPYWLPISLKQKTMSKWHVDQCKKYVQYAFLRQDKLGLNIYLLQVTSSLILKVRQSDYNKDLIELETKMLQDYYNSKLVQLNYVEPGTYCLVRIKENTHPESGKTIYTINRCKIIGIVKEEKKFNYETGDFSEEKYSVECLDHGDIYDVTKACLYLASTEYISRMPFQSINCSLSDLNNDLLIKSPEIFSKVIDLLYDHSRNEKQQLVELKALLNQSKDLYLYVKLNQNSDVPNALYTHKPLISLLEEALDRKDLFLNKDTKLRECVRFIESDELVEKDEEKEEQNFNNENGLLSEEKVEYSDKTSQENAYLMNRNDNDPIVSLMLLVLKDMIEEELSLAKRKECFHHNGVTSKPEVC